MGSITHYFQRCFKPFVSDECCDNNCQACSIELNKLFAKAFHLKPSGGCRTGTCSSNRDQGGGGGGIGFCSRSIKMEGESNMAHISGSIKSVPKSGQLL